MANETVDKKRYNYWEDMYTLERLELLADSRKTTVSELIRQATKTLLDNAPETLQPTPGQLELF